jgi:MFS transporter, DHA2 family, triacylglyceride efflux pump
MTTDAIGTDRPASSPSPRAILWAVGFSVFVAADDLTVVSTMLRPIIGDLGLVLPDGLDDAAWIVNAYLIAFIAIMPIAGRLSDVIGRRRTFMLAYAIFTVGTIWIPLADSLGPLLIGRVLTAIGGGAMVPVALAVVGDVYPAEKRARALGTLGAIETLGWVWGPLYGAMLVRFLSWRWQFWLNVPLALGGAIAVWWALADHDRSTARVQRVDWLGAGLLTTALVSLNLALLGSAEVQSVQGLDELTGNNSTDFRLLYPLALAATVAFVWQQRRLRAAGRDQLIDTRLFRGRNVRVALIVNFLVGAGLVIAMVDVPLFINAVEIDLERSAVVAGWILSALTAAMAIASYVGGRVTERTWYGPPIVLGLVASTLAYGLMGFTWGGDTPYPLLAAQLALLGAGIGLTVAPTTSAVVDHADPDARGAAAAVVMVVRMIGLSVGLSALTAWGLARFNALRGDLDLPPLTDPEFPAALAEATENLTAQSIADTFLASAAALGVGLVLCLTLLRRRAATAADPTDAEPTNRAPDPEQPEEEVAMTTDDNATNPTLDNTPEESDVNGVDDDPITAENPRIDATPPIGDTDEMPVIAMAASDGAVPIDEPIDDEPRLSSAGWIHRNLVAVMSVFALALLGSLVLLAVMFTKANATQNELDDTRAELATTRDDMERVEAGAAIFASQVNGFVEQVNELGPSIDDGLDQAVTGLEDFGSSTIDFTVNIDENISIQQDFAIDRTIAVPISTSIPIDEEFDTRITINGPFGVDIPLDITVPIDLDVPIDLTVDIPINETIPIDVDVPVQLDVPISVDVKGTELEALTASLIEGLRAFQAGLGGLTGN